MSKRITQWVIINRFGEVTHCYDTEAECQEALLGDGDADGCTIRRLVEYDKPETVVSKAELRKLKALLYAVRRFNVSNGISTVKPEGRRLYDALIEVLASSKHRKTKRRRK